MDIEEISGPKVPDVIHPPATSDELVPVEEKARLSPIRVRTGPHEDIDRWIVEDRVTISSKARRKYKQMYTAKKNNPNAR